MIETKHYVAHWVVFDASGYFNGADQSFFKRTERFRTKEEAEKKVVEELEVFKLCTEPISSAKWFKNWCLNRIDECFKVCESHEIY